MVRLKEYSNEKIRYFIWFQFHYGTIKSAPSAQPAVTPTNFNSTMVRLKVWIPICWLINFPDFNSTMVRLKVSRRSLVLPLLLHFNSTMVRLKGCTLSFICVRTWFQFHYGTIKRPRPRREFRERMLFQFHYGTIKSPLIEVSSQIAEISIPLWYD